MQIVVDTSAPLAVLFNEPGKQELIGLTRGAELIAPQSVHWEIGNALSAMLKQRRITASEAQRALNLYRKIPIRMVDVSLYDSLEIAAEYRIYACDAYVIACARACSCGLLSLDRGLRHVARLAGVTILEVSA